jgi:transposase-like protein
LAEAFPYLILDARYERVRESGIIVSQAVLIAIGIDWGGRRQVLAAELANRESRSSWRDFLLGLKERGLHGVEFVVADDHAGLRAALREVLAEAAYQRCYVHFLRNALDYVPRRVDDDCLQELRWLYDRRDLPEARRDLAAWLAKWSGKYPKLTGWVEENIDETLTFYCLPRQHHKHLKSTNMLERLNEEIRRRTHVVRIFPNGESCLRLVRALAVETHENWLEQHRYLNMDDLREHKREALRRAVPPDPRPVQPSTVLARSRTLRAGSAGAAAFAPASLTAAARGRSAEGRSGRRDGRIRSNKGMLLLT